MHDSCVVPCIICDMSKAASKAVNLVLSGVSLKNLMLMPPVSIIEHWSLEGCIKSIVGVRRFMYRA